MRDLAPVAAINLAVHVLAVHPALGVRTVAELIAKAKAAPGTIDYASSGPGTPYHIAGEVFRAMAGIDINHIPFRGSNEARTALIAGQVPMMFDAIPTMREQIAAAACSAWRPPGRSAARCCRTCPCGGHAAGLRSRDLARPDGATGTPGRWWNGCMPRSAASSSAGAAQEAMARGGAFPCR